MARARSGRLAVWVAVRRRRCWRILVFGGTWLYIHVIEGPAPAPLSLKSGCRRVASQSASAASSASAGTASASAVAGTWQVSSGSVVGYRVNEVLAGQNNVAVGRTSDVSGQHDDPRQFRHRRVVHGADGHHQERREPAGRAVQRTDHADRHVPDGNAAR